MPKLIITETTKRTSFKIGGAPVVVNQEYDLSLQSTIEIQNTFGYPAEPIDFFLYKIIDTNINSTNEGTVKISYQVDITVMPIQYNLVQSISINDSIVFSDLIPGSNNYDRIIITSLQGKGFWLLSGNPIEVGQVLFYYQVFQNLNFVASDPGSKNNYNILKFKFGHKLEFWPYENSISIDTVSLAELNTSNDSVVPELNESIESLDYDVSIINGPENGTFELLINTTGFTGIGSPAQNKLVVINNGVETVFSASGTFPYTGALTAEGICNLQFSIRRVFPYNTNSSISIDLSLINSDTEAINTEKDNIVLNIPKSIVTP